MRISVTDAGKRFNRDWIFRGIRMEFSSGKKYAITGHNGSGKSTLLQCIAGSMLLSEGKIEYSDDNQILEAENWHLELSIAAPYLELIEEMTAMEFLSFHQAFKPLKSAVDASMLLETVGLGKAANKQIRYFSSGMKQRLKLGQAFFSDTQILFLDEPCSNLDRQGTEIYHKLMAEHTDDRLVLICSNDENEYRTCDETIRLGV